LTKVQKVYFLYEYTFEEEAEIDLAASLYGVRRLDAAFPKAVLAAVNTRAEARLTKRRRGAALQKCCRSFGATVFVIVSAYVSL